MRGPSGTQIDGNNVQSIEPLKTTDGLGESKGGLWKKWPWKDPDHRELMSDLILKANYSIQDFNAVIKDGFSPNIKDTVFLTALATWIKDAYWQINCTCLKEEIRTKFEFSRQDELTEARNYLEAVRSIVIAHPLNSTRHEGYGFGPEGRICIDVRRKSFLDSYPGTVIFRITPKGSEKTDSVEDNEIALMTCRRTQTEKGKLHFERCCLDMCDIRNSAQIYIDALYELDRYLGRIKKNDFFNKTQP